MISIDNKDKQFLTLLNQIKSKINGSVEKEQEKTI